MRVVEKLRGEWKVTYAAIEASSALPSSGTGLGFGLRVKVSFEASSSLTSEVPLLETIEGAVAWIMWFTPDFVSSSPVCGRSDWEIVEGDILVG